jgi:hypothetical protein
MTVYNEARVCELYPSSLASAIRKLMQIRVFGGNEPSFSGLGGWVFEQTIQYCIRRELEAHKVKAEIVEQVKLKPRIRADLKIGNAAIEIKASGLFDTAAIAKYQERRKAANDLGWEYLFITGGESYQPYRRGITMAPGEANTFFLDTRGDWKRLISRLAYLNRGLGARLRTHTR